MVKTGFPSQRSPHGASRSHKDDDEDPGRVATWKRTPSRTETITRSTHADSRSLVSDILPQALEAGRAAQRAHQEAKLQGSIPDGGKRQRKQEPEERMRVTDPW